LVKPLQKQQSCDYAIGMSSRNSSQKKLWYQIAAKRFQNSRYQGRCVIPQVVTRAVSTGGVRSF
jgi:hypothetical protein